MILALPASAPQIHASAWVAPGATLVGRVLLGERASVWYSAVIRGDDGAISIGKQSNVQDGCVLHAGAVFPLVVGDGVTVGHRVILHGCVIEDDVLIGMGAVVMDGAVIGKGSIVGAAALVTQGMRIPPGSLVTGSPARVRRSTTQDERLANREAAQHYSELVRTLHSRAAKLPDAT